MVPLTIFSLVLLTIYSLVLLTLIHWCHFLVLFIDATHNPLVLLTIYSLVLLLGFIHWCYS